MAFKFINIRNHKIEMDFEFTQILISKFQRQTLNIYGFHFKILNMSGLRFRFCSQTWIWPSSSLGFEEEKLGRIPSSSNPYERRVFTDFHTTCIFNPGTQNPKKFEHERREGVTMVIDFSTGKKAKPKPQNFAWIDRRGHSGGHRSE